MSGSSRPYRCSSGYFKSQKHSRGFTAVALDLTLPDAALAAFGRAAAEAGGAFDLVVNNAGYGVFGEFAVTDWAVWQAQLGAMLGTSLQLVHAAYGRMRAQDRSRIATP